MNSEVLLLGFLRGGARGGSVLTLGSVRGSVIFTCSACSRHERAGGLPLLPARPSWITPERRGAIVKAMGLFSSGFCGILG